MGTAGLVLALLSSGCHAREPVSLPIASGMVVAPGARPEAYLTRLEVLGGRHLLVPWTEATTDIGAIASAIRGRDVDLVLGLSPARRVEEEWNAPDRVEPALEAAIARAASAKGALGGVYLEDLAPGSPDAEHVAYLDAALARVRAEVVAPVSVGITAPALSASTELAAPVEAPVSSADRGAWAEAWAEVLSPRVDRVIVHVDDSVTDLERLEDDLGALRDRLDARVELWATVPARSPLAPSAMMGLARVPSGRPREAIARAARLLENHASAVLISGAEDFEPERFLAPEGAARSVPLPDRDLDLEGRALAVGARLRRCCLRDGQVLPRADRGFDLDRGPNLEDWPNQEDGPDFRAPPTCATTGLYAAAMAFRFASTGEPTAAEEAKEAWRALHTLAVVSGRRGDVAQTFTRGYTGPLPDGGAGSRWRRASEGGLDFVPGASVGELAGWFLGAAVYADLAASEAEHAEVAADVSAVLDDLLTHDLRRTDEAGATLLEGDLHETPLVALAFLQVGAHLTGDARYRTELLSLLDAEREHIAGSRAAGAELSARGAVSAPSALYLLLAYETEAPRRAELQLALDALRARRRRAGDAYADVVHGVFHRSLDGGRRAAHVLRTFEPAHLDNAGWLAAREVPEPSPFVPFADRPGAELDFAAAPPGTVSLQGGLETRFSGVTFLLAYWMGRFHGVTAAQD